MKDLVHTKRSRVGSLRLRGMHTITQWKPIAFCAAWPWKGLAVRAGPLWLEDPRPEDQGSGCRLELVLGGTWKQVEEFQRHRLLYAFRREIVARPTAVASSFTVVAARRCGCAAVARQSLKLWRLMGPGGSGGRRKAG